MDVYLTGLGIANPGGVWLGICIFGDNMSNGKAMHIWCCLVVYLLFVLD